MEVDISGTKVQIDESDYTLFAQYKWGVYSGSRRIPYVSTTTKPRRYLHKLIMNAGPELIVDHKNGDTLDNRRANLRICTICQNNQNAITRKDNRTGVKGVCWDSRDRRWRVFIQANGKRKSLGSFMSLSEAREVYEKNTIELHGAFSVLNR
jgi:hypothetical protein